MIPVRRVVLYKHGVGYFEREGSVDDDATIELQFKSSEMNDVLKSLTTIDMNGGIISSVSYESSKPIEKQLEDISIRLSDSAALSDLINQLKGARVSVAVAGNAVHGEIVGIQPVSRTRDGWSVTDYRLVLLVEGEKMQGFDLLEIQSISIMEEKLRKDIGHLLETLISSKKKDLKKVSIFAKGKGKRDVNISYIVETPVWKTSYRVLLLKDEKPLVQGWAIIDNTQDEDWENVHVSLIAGLPISFVHNLYSARYRRRPVVEVEEEEAYAPPVLEEPLASKAAPAEEGEYAADESMVLGAMQGGGAAKPEVRRAKMKEAYEQKVDVQKRVIEAGDLYAYEIKNPVTVKRGQSALVPILAERFEGKRIAIYNQEIREKNPMSAILFKNTTGMTLEGGPVTVIENEDYVGEAMLDTIKGGGEKILPYSVELGCVISIDHQSSNQSVYRSVITNGVLYLYYYQISERIYVINNKSDRVLDLFLEHRFNQGWELVDTPEPVEKTENFYRFRFDVPAKKERRFVVKERGSQYWSYYLTSLTRDQLKSFMSSKYLDKETEKTIRDLIDVQEKIAKLDRTIHARDESLKTIFKNQERLRQNLQVLGTRQEETELRQRYIKQLSAEEDKVQALTKEIEELKAQKHELELGLAEKLKTFQFEVMVK